MIIGLAQINSEIAHFEKNYSTIMNYAQKAHRQGVSLLIFPELCICGYPPLDLCFDAGFIKKNVQYVQKLQENLPPSLATVVGAVLPNPQKYGKRNQNVTLCLKDQTIVCSQAKWRLPNYDVFNEERFFSPASTVSSFSLDTRKIGFAICEDIWQETERPFESHYMPSDFFSFYQSLDLLIVPSASPYYFGKKNLREKIVKNLAKQIQTDILYVNRVGGQDDLIFDGASFSCSAQGQILSKAPVATEGLFSVDLENPPESRPLLRKKDREMKDLYQLLQLGLRDYVQKTGFNSVHLGLSGGIDSALVASIATEALSPEKVTGIILPSPFNSEQSRKDAEHLACNLGIQTLCYPISDIYKNFKSLLGSDSPPLMFENIQARIRAVILMAHSQKAGSLLLNTGNKSEFAVGYCTLYGDMAGALAVIGDLFKSEVYKLCYVINREKDIIPSSILTKEPSAELHPSQKDSDSLPPYDILDKILMLFLLERYSPEQIIEKNYPASVVKDVLKRLFAAEFKRHQAPPVLKVSPLSFGSGRRIPIAIHHDLR